MGNSVDGVAKRSNDVFISYRRDTSELLTLALWQFLDRAQIDAFYDIESIRTGKFPQIILNQIKARPYFLLVLTPGTLDRCVDPGDWLRREIEHATATNRRIVSVRSPEFAHADYERFLPLALGREIAEWQSLELPPYRFLRHAARELIEEYLAPVDDVAVQPVPSADRDVVADVRAGAAAAPKVTSQQLTAAQYFERGSQEPDPEQAIVDYTRALEADPDYIVAQINRGIEYQRLGQFESAVADLTSVIEANPDYQNGLVWRAEALLELGEFEAGIEDLDRAIDLQHADGYAIYLRGRARLGHGQFEAAFTDYTRAIELGYDDSEAFVGRAHAREAVGDEEGARSDREHAAKLKTS